MKNCRACKILFAVFLVMTGIGFCVLFFYFFSAKYSPFPLSPLFSKPFQNTSIITSPSSFPAPPRAIPHGKIGFTVSQSDKTKPQFGKGFIDPYDPAKGQSQIVTIGVKDEQPITQVTAVLKTDNAVSQPVSFKLINGPDIDGIWQGSWLLDDTYLYTYNLVLTAVSARGKSSVEITLRKL